MTVAQETSALVRAVPISARPVLEHWFRRPCHSPSCLEPLGRRIAASGIKPHPSHVYSTASAYVAALVLRDIRHRLPDVSASRVRGKRRRQGFRGVHGLPASPVGLLPRFLFRLNWATHGTGVSWPVDYYATWLPDYRRWVVTGSSDTTDLWGIRDVALGWFDDRSSLRDGARDVLLRDWRGDLTTYSPFPWEAVQSSGAVDPETAQHWRAQVWPEFAG